MTFHYITYGLVFASDLELPELQSISTEKSVADVAIKFGPVPADGLPGGRQISPFIWVGTDDFWLEVPQVARFRVSDKRQITIDPAPGIDEASIRVFLLGSGLGALLFQRGMLILHGNAIEIDGHCMVCVGPSGAGKSTLAAAFAQRGYRLLADDVVPIDPAGCAVPGFPRIKLWQDTADKLGIQTDELQRIRPELKKYNLPTRTEFCEDPRPVRWIYRLSPHHRSDITLTPLTGIEKFKRLRENTYRHRFMVGMSLQATHLEQCGALANQARMALAERPSDGFEIDRLVDALLADVKGNS
ncbi:hypothetical protein B6V73_16490 [Thioclava sp. JM3]|uniref:hypothetical protein n=1 Tax=Thioclava sp. JM3 TaxID=1973004 RepID=UPI000B53B98A|nr:hypothetical protein [Thioclava sp. JM3]OWY14196.1 hypothetical protein B6V73_16490 [Thioclava sp. JM3]